MLEHLKIAVYKANMALKEAGLVILTWGNASGFDHVSGLVVIKPSGVSYSELSPDNMVVVNLDGEVVEGSYKPSSDTKTHIELYKAFPELGGIVHTHSRMATSFSQAGMSITPMGTTHADYFYGEIPCSKPLEKHQIDGDYEKETGITIVNMLKDKNPLDVPAVLVNEHGPFTWGLSVEEAVYHSIVLEEVSIMAFNTLLLNKSAHIQNALLDKHYYRKHGSNSYYGQK
ncbi:MAG: L-ribulose-5-phosphate 4-epimerase AraD [Vallitaleaceae bacterium]|jgi:L-ribulose-5-phosphate 4-epimerase|nr:L-ribulose-5-phosphate 4-epimerase AraD [Vallitaleaceae bacterium]